MIGLGKGQPGQTEGNAGDTGLGDEQRVDRHQRIDMVDAVMNAPGKTGPVTDQRRDQAWHQRAILDPTDRQHLQCKDRARNRRPEDRAEPSRDPGHKEGACRFRIQSERASKPAGKTAAQLHGGAFTSRRSPEQMCHDRAEEDERSHAQRHAAPRFVDLLDDEVVAAFDRAPCQMVEQSDHEPADRQQVEQPGKGEAKPGYGVEAPQEGRAERSHRCGHRDQDQSPPQYRRGMGAAIANERCHVELVIEIAKCRAHDSSLLPCGAW